MFVIMASWNKVQREHPAPRDPATLPERVGSMLQMAGSSITITSFTDVVAFYIGSITVNAKYQVLLQRPVLKKEFFFSLLDSPFIGIVLFVRWHGRCSHFHLCQHIRCGDICNR